MLRIPELANALGCPRFASGNVHFLPSVGTARRRGEAQKIMPLKDAVVKKKNCILQNRRPQVVRFSLDQTNSPDQRREHLLVFGMRLTASCAQIDERPAGKLSFALFNKRLQCYYLQRGPYLCLPVIASRVRIFCVDVLRRVNCAGFNILKAVGFFPDVFDLLDPNMPPLQ